MAPTTRPNRPTSRRSELDAIAAAIPYGSNPTIDDVRMAAATVGKLAAVTSDWAAQQVVNMCADEPDDPFAGL